MDQRQNEWAVIPEDGNGRENSMAASGGGSADAALRLLGGDKLPIVLQLSRKDLTFQKLQRCVEDISAGGLRSALEELQTSGIVKEISGNQKADTAEKYALTELGREVQPVLKALEDFGRLYQKLAALGIDPGSGAGFAWEEPAEEEGKEPACEKAQKSMTDPEASRKTAADKQAAASELVRQRHGWAASDGRFLFYNSHVGYENWYFYGEENRDTGKADIWLITAQEYEKLSEELERGCRLQADMGGMCFGISCDRSDVLPELETFYIAAEDALIAETMCEA